MAFRPGGSFLSLALEQKEFEQKEFCVSLEFDSSLRAVIMLQPLAIVFFERLMPGSQLVNRLQDLNYRVLVINNAALLAATAKRETPLLLLADLDASAEVCTAIEKIKADPASAHLP